MKKLLIVIFLVVFFIGVLILIINNFNFFNFNIDLFINNISNKSISFNGNIFIEFI